MLRDDGIGSVVFAHKTTEGWEALLSGMIKGGWTLTGSWPIATEMSTRPNARETASLATSIHLICRPRPDERAGRRLGRRASRTARARRGLDGAPAGRRHPRRGSVFACIGPALEIFSRYRVVETAEGRPVSCRSTWRRSGKSSAAPRWRACSAQREAKARNGLAGALEEDARLTALFLWTLQATTGDATGETDAQETDAPADGAHDDVEDASAGKAKGFSLVVRRCAPFRAAARHRSPEVGEAHHRDEERGDPRPPRGAEGLAHVEAGPRPGGEVECPGSPRGPGLRSLSCTRDPDRRVGLRGARLQPRPYPRRRTRPLLRIAGARRPRSLEEAATDKGFITARLDSGEVRFWPVQARAAVSLAPVEATGGGTATVARRLNEALAGVPGGIDGKLLRVPVRGLSADDMAALDRELLAQVRRRVAELRVDALPGQGTSHGKGGRGAWRGGPPGDEAAGDLLIPARRLSPGGESARA